MISLATRPSETLLCSYKKCREGRAEDRRVSEDGGVGETSTYLTTGVRD